MPIDNQYIDRTLKDFKYVLLKTRLQLEDLKQEINQTLNNIRSFNSLINENQFQSNQKNPFILTDCTEPANYLCKKCPRKFSTFNHLSDHNQIYHERCSYCKENFLESRLEHEDFVCGSVKLHCDICFANVQRKQIDRHVKICSFRKCHKCNVNIYVKGFGYHLKKCGKQNVGQISKRVNANVNKNEGYLKRAGQIQRPVKIEREDAPMLPCSMWIR